MAGARFDRCDGSGGRRRPPRCSTASSGSSAARHACGGRWAPTRAPPRISRAQRARSPRCRAPSWTGSSAARWRSRRGTTPRKPQMSSSVAGGVVDQLRGSAARAPARAGRPPTGARAARRSRPSLEVPPERRVARGDPGRPRARRRPGSRRSVSSPSHQRCIQFEYARSIGSRTTAIILTSGTSAPDPPVRCAVPEVERRALAAQGAGAAPRRRAPRSRARRHTHSRALCASPGPRCWAGSGGRSSQRKNFGSFGVRQEQVRMPREGGVQRGRIRPSARR